MPLKVVEVASAKRFNAEIYLSISAVIQLEASSIILQREEKILMGLTVKPKGGKGEGIFTILPDKLKLISLDYNKLIAMS